MLDLLKVLLGLVKSSRSAIISMRLFLSGDEEMLNSQVYLCIEINSQVLYIFCFKFTTIIIYYSSPFH